MPEAMSDPRPAAEETLPTPDGAVLARAERERAAAVVARDAAEGARDRAEVARDAAEGAGDAARLEVRDLLEAVAFCREQMRGTRELAAHLEATELADLRAECASLREELRLFDAELQDRARADAARDEDARTWEAVAHDPGVGRHGR